VVNGACLGRQEPPIWEGDNVGDKVDALWPEETSDGTTHYYPAVITQLRGEDDKREVCVRWENPKGFKATCWLGLGQLRDWTFVPGSTIQKGFARKAAASSRKAAASSRKAAGNARWLETAESYR
jgi:hypothetical protein